MPGLDPTVVDRASRASGIEAAEVLACRSIVMTILFGGQAEFSSHGIDDPAVRLMRNQPVDICRDEIVGAQSLVDDLAQALNGMTKDLAALHPQKARARGRGGAAVDIKNVVLAAVRMQMVRQNEAAIGEMRVPPSAPGRRPRRQTVRRCRGPPSRGCAKMFLRR